MSISTISRQVRRPPEGIRPAPARTPILRILAPSAEHRHAVPAPAPARTTSADLPRTVSENLGVATLHGEVVDYANLDHAASTPRCSR